MIEIFSVYDGDSFVDYFTTHFQTSTDAYRKASSLRGQIKRRGGDGIVRRSKIEMSDDWAIAA